MAGPALVHEQDPAITTAPNWFPTNEELARRPLVHGIAIDPPNPYEIDDAIHAEPLDKENRLFRYSVHIADGGLLEGTEHMDTAREKGWSVYHPDGSADLMLPRDVTRWLDLDRPSAVGQPALTVAFTAGENLAPTDVDVFKSRLICEGMTYARFAYRIRTHYRIDSPHEFPEEAQVFAASRFIGSGRPIANYDAILSRKQNQVPFYHKRARKMVGLYMLAANIRLANLSLADGVPHIFRNHHMGHFDHPEGSAIRELYPDSELFAQHNIAWYSRIPTVHEGIGGVVYGHGTSPSRRSPDLFSSVNRSAAMEGRKPPFNEAFLDGFTLELAEKVKKIMRLGNTAALQALAS